MLNSPSHHNQVTLNVFVFFFLILSFQYKGVQTFPSFVTTSCTYHICESHVEEEACGDCCYPLFGCRVGGDCESDVEADKGGQSAAHV